ncbi:hypothetical protein PUNSTDRAFT_145475 [Punctularia strigosozonata HHB-11173 SS5]|uniref:uncharacterized protein n=1 Tax=Punctularia strigosozonata (strain HHB-11173) TaxID=741275 RepID=UPI0004416384|nr:uncharacterized protein PUNSTDRAFT_145475 [Punctularia strigosozonata HHB-11173 SS5]EIN06144.1 hypothetical protein PUNSTDRAFT_145475 [Punctularia strigosozonata HHB-11173 SS5]
MSFPSSADRPATSKPRGICRFYSTSRGCLNPGCKFLHGENEVLTPYDRNKVCKFFASGFCKRGDRCWFRHIIPEANDEPCSICLEKPVTYGLLTACSHIFCITCLRSWRDTNTKSSDAVVSGNLKSCPLCRTPSRFVVPSSRFFPQGHPDKDAAIARFKESTARVDCRYFQKSPADSRFCPFGKDCFYRHINADGTPYVFSEGVDYYMPIHKRRLNSHLEAVYIDWDVEPHMAGLNVHVVDLPASLTALSSTIDAIRANLAPRPAFNPDLGFDEEEGDEDYTEDFDANDMLHMTATLLEGLQGLRASMGPLASRDDADADTDSIPSLRTVSGDSASGSDSEDGEAGDDDAFESVPRTAGDGGQDQVRPGTAPRSGPGVDAPLADSPSRGGDAPSPVLNVRRVGNGVMVDMLSGGTLYSSLPRPPIERDGSPLLDGPASAEEGLARDPSAEGLTVSISPRFSTVVNTAGRVVIDLASEEETMTEDEEDSEAEGGVNTADEDDHASAGDDEGNAEAAPGSSAATDESRTDALPPSHPSALPQPSEDAKWTHPPQIEFDADPPFATDGRGRVVWSSAHHRFGRGRRGGTSKRGGSVRSEASGSGSAAHG